MGLRAKLCLGLKYILKVFYKSQQEKMQHRNVPDPSYPSDQRDLHQFFFSVSFVVSIRIAFRVSSVKKIELQINVKGPPKKLF